MSEFNNLYYEIEENGIKITGVVNPECQSLTIPQYIKNKPVKYISAGALSAIANSLIELSIYDNIEFKPIIEGGTIDPFSNISYETNPALSNLKNINYMGIQQNFENTKKYWEDNSSIGRKVNNVTWNTLFNHYDKGYNKLAITEEYLQDTAEYLYNRILNVSLSEDNDRNDFVSKLGDQLCKILGETSKLYTGTPKLLYQGYPCREQDTHMLQFGGSLGIGGEFQLSHFILELDLPPQADDGRTNNPSGGWIDIHANEPNWTRHITACHGTNYVNTIYGSWIGRPWYQIASKARSNNSDNIDGTVGVNLLSVNTKLRASDFKPKTNIQNIMTPNYFEKIYLNYKRNDNEYINFPKNTFARLWGIDATYVDNK